MKIASIVVHGEPTLGVVNDAQELVCIQALGRDLPGAMKGFLALEEPTRRRLTEQAANRPGDVALDEAVFQPVVPDPHAVWCATLNYAAHVREGDWERPQRAGWFLRTSSSLVGHAAAMEKPTISDTFDWEGELAVVVGRPGRHIAEADALRHVAGYACFNDGSVREWQRHSTQITIGKNFTATGGFGPYLVTPDEVPDITQARLMTRLNGETMQEAKISEMTFAVPELIAYLSAVTELRTGDVIVTGTPGGVGARKVPPVFMYPGDVVEVEIDGLGVLRNPVTQGGAR